MWLSSRKEEQSQADKEQKEITITLSLRAPVLSAKADTGAWQSQSI